MIGKILAVGFVCAGAAFGQMATAPAAVGVKIKPYAFEVVSIRQNPNPHGSLHEGPTPDGYRTTFSPMILTFREAYVPQVGGAVTYTIDQIKGLPDWVENDRYDIDARISDADRAEWQKSKSQKVMLPAMLQAMFAERCKLVLHREVTEGEVDSLVLAKGGPKFKETDPTVEHPEGIKMSGGNGVVVPTKDGMSFYGVSMTFIASQLSAPGAAGRPVQDKTGLTGRYDITIKSLPPDGPAAEDQQSPSAASDPGSSFGSVLSSLGLKLEKSKGQVETLVIDHIERPSEN